jgi:hypothetical protein
MRICSICKKELTAENGGRMTDYDREICEQCSELYGTEKAPIWTPWGLERQGTYHPYGVGMIPLRRDR